MNLIFPSSLLNADFTLNPAFPVDEGFELNTES